MKGKAAKPKGRSTPLTLSPLGGICLPPLDPPPVVKAPWFFTVVKLELEAGGGTVPVSTVRKALQAQLILDCVEPSVFMLSFHKAYVYTNSYDNSATANVLPPTLTVGFSSLLTLDAGSSTQVAARRQISDVGTQARPAKVGYKWGTLGRVPINGTFDSTALEVNCDLDTDIYVHLMWSPSFFVNTFKKAVIRGEGQLTVGDQL